MSALIRRIQKKLKLQSEQRVRETGRGFFKEKIKMHGVMTPVTRKIGKEYFREIKDAGKRRIFDLCEELWESGYIEESFIACHWSYYIRKQYDPGEMKLFEKWVRVYVDNWASCDTLCNHSVGTLVEMYPECVSHLKKWTASK
ncbi:MAG: DNA alkylation repair protein, partial [Chrysiogenales bacterium]